MDATITNLFNAYRGLTGSAEAAATLVLAEVQIGQQARDKGGAFSVVQAAKELGVSKEMVYRLCNENALPHSRIGRRITISSQQLAEFQTRPKFRHLALT
jgi:excisionase family DNA binding protein